MRIMNRITSLALFAITGISIPSRQGAEAPANPCQPVHT